MLKRVLLIGTVALALSVAAFGAYSAFGHKGHAEAASPIHCTVDTTAAPNMTITCTGQIQIVTPWATKTLAFALVVNALDNNGDGRPDFGDQIIGCTLGVNNSAPHAVHVGPCP